MSLAQTFILLADSPLPGGYRQLTLQAERAFIAAPRPGHYLRTVLTGETPPLYAPIMQLQTADRFLALARKPVRIATGTRIQNAFIEGATPAPDPQRPRLALVSADDALACSIFASSLLRQKSYKLTAFACFKDAPPFTPAPSQILMPASPPGAIAAVPLLDSWNIPSRLASAREQSGIHHGDIYGLLEPWWREFSGNEHAELQIMGFGGGAFLHGLEEWCRARAIPLITAEIPA